VRLVRVLINNKLTQWRRQDLVWRETPYRGAEGVGYSPPGGLGGGLAFPTKFLRTVGGFLK